MPSADAATIFWNALYNTLKADLISALLKDLNLKVVSLCASAMNFHSFNLKSDFWSLWKFVSVAGVTLFKKIVGNLSKPQINSKLWLIF